MQFDLRPQDPNQVDPYFGIRQKSTYLPFSKTLDTRDAAQFMAKAVFETKQKGIMYTVVPGSIVERRSRKCAFSLVVI